MLEVIERGEGGGVLSVLQRRDEVVSSDKKISLYSASSRVSETAMSWVRHNGKQGSRDGGLQEDGGWRGKRRSVQLGSWRWNATRPWR